MTRFRKRGLIVVAVVAGLAAVAGLCGLRLLLVNSAQAALQTREYQQADIIGVRIPCRGFLDFGVAAVLWAREGGEPLAGRLCRTIGSGEWIWYPNEGQPRAK